MKYALCLIICLFPITLQAIEVGAARFEHYLTLLEGKRVSLVVNHTAIVGETHLLDTLIARNINVVSVMSPEHGFRGQSGAGELIENGKDSRTGLPIYSLYGKTKKPSHAMLSNTDVIVFDIQDVGARFYTYLSTLHYVLEAAAESGIKVVVLDRPNPNIAYIDGPVLDPAFRSFVGMHPIPVLHGMTLGELARMIQGEGWINRAQALDLTVVPVARYTRQTLYSLPVPPSPNLPNDIAIRVYPSLCLFEGTAVSVGRGTDWPFQIIGHNRIALGDARIEVAPTPAAPSPKLTGTTLLASRVSDDIAGFDLRVLINTYQQFSEQSEPFFTHPDFFDKLSGTDKLRKAIINGDTAEQIRQTWQPALTAFKQTRAAYLIYPEAD